MILQYKGFNNNWSYEEANSITWANVWIGKETRDYREGGIRHNQYTEECKKCCGREIAELDLSYVNEMHLAVNKLINKEVFGSTDIQTEIIFLVGDKRFDQLENICVVTLKDKNKFVTYAFTEGVYLLNNTGSTVQKLA